MVSPLHQHDSLDDLSATLDRALTMLYLLNGRTYELEKSNGELRAFAGLDPPKPSIGPDWLGLKEAVSNRPFAIRSAVADSHRQD